MSRIWPVELAQTLPDGGRVGLRAMRVRDQREYAELRRRNREWLRRWDPTNPHGPSASVSYGELLRAQRRAGRAGTAYAFGVTVDEALAGQVNASNVVLGAARSFSVGYWVGQEFAGRGVTPLAVSMIGDYLFGVAALHRMEINIRPENAASLAVVRKLGMREEGLRLRFLHIAGDWRDHRSFAVTADELGPGGLVGRLRG